MAGHFRSSTVNSRLAVRVTGQVQGVGFRWYVEEEARRWPVTGTVFNCADGSVRVIAEGLRPDLEAFLAALSRGPAGSRVLRVSVEWESASGKFSGFAIGATRPL